MPWRSRNSDPAEIDALYPGVPEWLLRPLLIWVQRATTTTFRNDFMETRQAPNVELLQEYETLTRTKRTRIVEFRAKGAGALFTDMDVDEVLDFVDFLVYKYGERGNQGREELGALEAMLSAAGSEWKVGARDGQASLEKRVPEGVAVAATQAILSNGSAGALLGEAWHAAFGRSPDYEEAYEKAIKAVEEAGAAVVLPNDPRATLGTTIRTMADQGDWKLPLGSPNAGAPVAMAQALWQGQESRHGGNSYRKPTHEEAEAAVLLAVPLVQWFKSGALARR